DVVVTEMRIVGFTFDGISVRGSDARNVRIGRIEAIDNLDDGVGVSAAAGPVIVHDSLLMGNGFRTKGKGLLVFDDATATLRDSVVVGNRDGVTVTRGSSARLERVLVAGNYDKGVGVSAASLTAASVQVLSNGYDPERAEPSPNGDGLRVGLGGSANFSDSRIAGSGDSGVVVLDTSTVELADCVVERNRGAQTHVAETGRLTQRRSR
ncbi:MAG: right-handed parallel beta-helix repeat-containing protein, partial [Candidatus Binatia bacterium]